MKKNPCFTIINLLSQKGGVGKTTIALLLAASLGKNLKDDSLVLLLDFDFTGTPLQHAMKLIKVSDDANPHSLTMYELISYPCSKFSENNNRHIMDILSYYKHENVKFHFISSFSNDNENKDDPVTELHSYLVNESYTHFIIEKLNNIIEVLSYNYKNIIVLLDHSPGWFTFSRLMTIETHFLFNHQKTIRNNIHIFSSDIQDIESTKIRYDYTVKKRDLYTKIRWNDLLLINKVANKISKIQCIENMRIDDVLSLPYNDIYRFFDYMDVILGRTKERDKVKSIYIPDDIEDINNIIKKIEFTS